MIAIIAEWMVQFFVVGLDWSRVPFVGPYQNDSPPAKFSYCSSGRNQAGILGTLVFNYAFVVTVPSWVNEKVRLRELLLALMRAAP